MAIDNRHKAGGGGGCVVLLLVIISLGIIFTRDDDDFHELKDRTRPSYNEYKRAAVATDAGTCSVIGRRMLQKGGSVVDAAIAAMLCVGLYNAHSTGIGGGSFMTIYNATTGETVVINSRDAAPFAAYKDMYKGDLSLSTEGASAIAVPGEIAGYWEAHQRFGKLKWKDLFEPSIKLAEDGYRVNSALAGAISSKEKWISNPKYNLESVFLHSNGSLKQEGDMIHRPSLAVTLSKIADEGAPTFYKGSLAKQIVADIQEATGTPSLITEYDLNSYSAEVNHPINITIGDLTVFVPGAPSGGPVLCLILNILKGYNLNEESMKGLDSQVLTYHRIIESFKFAFAKRTQLGDDRFDHKIREFVQNMTSDFYAERIRLKINDSSTQPVDYYGPVYNTPPDDGGTSHLSIVGKDGSAVSMTSTMNRYFGSLVRGSRTGIIFNNNMDDFSSPGITNKDGVKPFPSNFIEAGKRPLSSMSPTIIIRNGKVKMVAGAAGGTTIPTATSLVIMNNIWFGMDLNISVSLRRVHHQLTPDFVKYEDTFYKDVVEGLKGKNHVVKKYAKPASNVQAILRSTDDTLFAKCDDRKGGFPAGYGY